MTTKQQQSYTNKKTRYFLEFFKVLKYHFKWQDWGVSLQVELWKIVSPDHDMQELSK